MKLENQVVSLDLSKRLKELGFKQDSLFWWDLQGDIGDNRARIIYKNSEIMRRFPINLISTYTVAELGEMLPSIIQKAYSPRYELEYNFPIKNDEKYTDQDFVIRYRSEEKSFGVTAKTEADARAKMLIYLKENNLI